MGMIVDAHSDILQDVYERRLLGERGILKNYWIPKMKQGQISVRVLALYNGAQYLPEMALRRALGLITALYEEIDESENIVLCTSYQDLKEAKEDGKISFILGMEGSEPLGLDIHLLRIFYELGLRVLGLTHTRRTYLADGAPIMNKRMGKQGGITDIGVEFLERAEAMGIVIDVSHLNDVSFWDAMSFTKMPMIASHSNCRTLFNHPRNLTDEQIKAIANRGGVVGVNACSLFVGNGGLNKLIGHIEHLLEKGGREHVGLGLDFADYLVQYMAPSERAKGPLEGIKPVKGLVGDEDVLLIAESLAKKGYKSRDIDLIMGGNFMRVFKTILDNSLAP
jgi:membrane dipeptidase